MKPQAPCEGAPLEGLPVGDALKTSVIDVHDMLSVLSVPGVEKRIGEVPGVESVTVNHAAGSATVRYDETRLHVADIKSDVRQRGYESAVHEDTPKPAKEAGEPSSAQKAPQEAPQEEPGTAVLAAPVAADRTEKVDAKPTPPADTTPKEAPPDAASGPPNAATLAAPPAAAGAAAPQAVPADPSAGAEPDAQDPGLVEKATAWVRETLGADDKDKAEPDAPPAAPADDAAKSSAPPAVAGTPTDAHAGHTGHKPAAGARAMSADMAHEMGHSGGDICAMVRDMRNRFWICLVFTIPIFIYAPMGGMWPAPAPPFGLDLNLWLFFFATAAVVYPSWPFFVSAWRALKKGTLGMAALIVLSVGTGYLFSVGTTFFYKEGGQFFEAVAVLLVFILLGHWLEMRARAVLRRPSRR